MVIATTPLHITGSIDLSLVTTDGELIATSTYSNTVTLSGLSFLASALSFAGISNIAPTIGYLTPIDLTPLYGGIGTGDMIATPPSINDLILVNEIARSSATSGFSLNASHINSPAICAWVFYYPSASFDWTGGSAISEAGIFANASSESNFGNLLNHAALSPTPFSKPVGYNLQMQINLALGIPV